MGMELTVLKEKMLNFVAKYGFTYRGIAMATVLFPPAALYIAWRMPNASLPARLGLAVVALAVPAVMPLVIGGPILYLGSLISKQFS